MMSSSTPGSDERRSGGVRQSQFPVGRSRQRYAPVVDAGCGRGLRRRRPRLLGLPSFFGTGGSCRKGGGETAVTSGSGDGSRYCSSASTDSFSSSSNGTVTHSTGYSSSSSDYYWYYAYGGEGGAAAGTKQQQPAGAAHKAEAAAADEKELMGKKLKKKKKKKNKERRDDKTETTGGIEATEDAGVGVAVEKESSDPRADFRDSMAQMVVAEAGFRDWDGLQSMLRRLLALNAPRHHSAILAAFADVCAHIVALPAAAAAPSASPQQQASPPSYFQYRRR